CFGELDGKSRLDQLKGEFAHPPWRGILAGTSLQRLVELVRELRLLPVLGESQICWEELKQMPEVFLVGTTLDVVPVGRVDDCEKSQFTGALAFRKLLQNDQSI
ncbi:MAG: aminotransferase class IV, partial [Bdellovibrio sp.]